MAVIKRRRKTTANRRIHGAEQALLRDQVPGKDANKFTIHNFAVAAIKIWPAHCDDVMQEWIEERPGTRPLCWWIFDCPLTPTFKLGRPGEWALSPDRVPAARIQRQFLAKHGMLQESEIQIE